MIFFAPFLNFFWCVDIFKQQLFVELLKQTFMANKKLDTEKQNDGVAEATMSDEQMEQFVTEHLSIVPRNWRSRFDALPLDKKVSKIHFYIDMQQMRANAMERNKLENRVKELFIKRNATTEEVVKVIEMCKEYIQSTKEQEINKLQDEIERLTHLKLALEAN